MRPQNRAQRRGASARARAASAHAARGGDACGRAGGWKGGRAPTRHTARAAQSSGGNGREERAAECAARKGPDLSLSLSYVRVAQKAGRRQRGRAVRGGRWEGGRVGAAAAMARSKRKGKPKHKNEVEDQIAVTLMAVDSKDSFETAKENERTQSDGEQVRGAGANGGRARASERGKRWPTACLPRARAC